MRIQHTDFLLTLSVKHTNNNLAIEAYGSTFDKLALERQINNGVETIKIVTYMPNRVTIMLSGNETPSELVAMSLAGIKMNSDILSKVVEYKPSKDSCQSVQECIKNTSVKRLVWDQNGCVLINLFDPNPFAYHMYIGNKIRF
jgi:hypothetical protein